LPDQACTSPNTHARRLLVDAAWRHRARYRPSRDLRRRWTPADVQTAVLYDHFTLFTLFRLVGLGFCGRGEVKGFIADGVIGVGGRVPIDRHGGQLGEAYLHGMDGIAEGVCQLRGMSVNPVPDVEGVVVTAGAGVSMSGLVVG